MSYSEWADFVYYDIGGIASYNGIVYQALQANRNVVPTTLAPNWQLLPAPVGAGVSSLETLTGAITLSSPTATFTTAGNNIALTITYPVPPTPQVYQATYYKSVQQNLISPNTDITFDELGSWNNDGGYITHTNGTADFTVVEAGLYQLEFNISVAANGATWNNTSNKAVAIDITRAALGEQAVIQNNALTAINTSYQQAVASSFYLEAGDIINLRSTLPLSSGTPFAVGVQNTFDLNTFFAWTFVAP